MKLTLKSTRFTITLLLMSLTIGWAYWEFFHDIYPEEAIAFFQQGDRAISPDDGAFAIYGLTAPADVVDFQHWGYDSWSNPKSIKRFDMDWADNKGFRSCDEFGGGELDSECLNDDKIERLLEVNKLVLDRYKTALQFKKVDFMVGPGPSQRTILLTKLLSVNIRQKSERYGLSETDLLIVNSLIYFWNRLFTQEYLNQLDTANSLVNLGIASYLFRKVARRHPEIFTLFKSQYGYFDINRIDQNFINKMEIAEFHFWGSMHCVGSAFNFSQSKCKEEDTAFTLKPGRTANLLFGQRRLIAECDKETNYEPDYANEDSWFILFKSFMRPGNFEGRKFVYQQYNNILEPCDLIDNYQVRLWELGLVNLYLKLNDAGYSSSQISGVIESNPELFRIPNSDRYYFWKAKTKEIGLKYPMLGEDKDYQKEDLVFRFDYS